MLEECRPMGRLFYLLLAMVLLVTGAQAQGPATTTVSEVHYRGSGRAVTRVTNPAGIAALARGSDDGIRSVLRHVKEPAARTATDCANAALAILEGATGTAWKGEYDTWSDFLPGGAADIFPGDGLQVNAMSRGASFQAIVREVEVDLWDLTGERSRYKIKFADDNAKSLGFQFETATIAKSLEALLDLTAVPNTQVGSIFLADLTAAVITAASSTTIGVDAGAVPPSGGGLKFDGVIWVGDRGTAAIWWDGLVRRHLLCRDCREYRRFFCGRTMRQHHRNILAIRPRYTLTTRYDRRIQRRSTKPVCTPWGHRETAPGSAGDGQRLPT